MVVQQELDKLGIEYGAIHLGEVEIREDLSQDKAGQLKERLEHAGFELIEDKTAKLISDVKREVIAYVRGSGEQKKIKFSNHLSETLCKDYNYLSQTFSAVEGITIEQYMIRQKVEYVKELIVYDELSLSEIAWKLGYSSVQHLSTQFKKVTGLTPRHFKTIGSSRRKPIDTL